MARRATYSVDLDGRQAVAEARRIGGQIAQGINQGAQAAGGAGRPASAGGSGGLGGYLLGGLAGYLTASGVQQLGRAAGEFAEYSIQVQNAEAALIRFAGSAYNAERIISTIQTTSGGAIDRFEAMKIANQNLTLGMANNAEEFERLISLVQKISAVMGVDMAKAMSEVQLSASNLTTMRLDTLGINATQTKDRFEELRGSMDDSRAMLLAILETGEQTFAGLDAAIQQSGIAQLKTVFADIKTEATGAGSAIDRVAGYVADNLRYALDARSLTEQLTEITKIQEGALTEGQRTVQAAIKENLQAFNVAVVTNNFEAQNALIGSLGALMEAWDRAGQAAEPVVKNLYELTEAEKAAIQTGYESAEAFAAMAGGIDKVAQAYQGMLYLNIPGGLSAIEQAATLAQQTLDKYKPETLQSRLAAERRTDYSAPTVAYSIDSNEQRNLQRASYEHQREIAEFAQREWLSATRTMADDFKAEMASALRSVPGLFAPSSVTGADFGPGYTDKADEYLRRLTDEVVNGIDWAGVDIQDAAARAGIDPSLPAQRILELFTSAWDDSSLFAGGENLDLFNADAVKTAIERQKASKSGEQAIIDYFEGVYGPSVATGAIGNVTDAAQDYTGGLSSAMRDQFNNDDTQQPFIGFGDTVIGLVHKGYAAGAENFDWVGAIMAAAQSQAASQVVGALGEALNGG